MQRTVKTKIPSLLAGLAACAASLLAMVSGVAAEEGATQTPQPMAPAPTAMPSPDLSVPPTMPAGITREGDARFCWTDSSDNEDGFEIGVEFCDRSFRFTVGPNVTCIELPPGARSSAFPDDCIGAYYFTVTAFNAAGRSFPQLWWIPVRKGAPPTAAPTPTALAPKTGAPPPGRDGGSGWALPLLAAGGSLLVLSGALAAMIWKNRPVQR